MTERYTTETSEEALDAVRQAGLKLVRRRFKIILPTSLSFWGHAVRWWMRMRFR